MKRRSTPLRNTMTRGRISQSTGRQMPHRLNRRGKKWRNSQKRRATTATAKYLPDGLGGAKKRRKKPTSSV